MTKLNKWVLIEAGHDEDDCDIDVGILQVLDNEEEAKEALKKQVEEWQQDGCDDDEVGDNISWNDDETEATITGNDDDYCSDWCKVYKIEEI